MSKQSEAKEKQGFEKVAPNCSMCKHFIKDVRYCTYTWSVKVYEIHTNLRCSLGNFKVGKTSSCKMLEKL